MIDFNCEHCYEEIIVDHGVQLTECEHYPANMAEQQYYIASDYIYDIEDDYREHYEE